jgi:hypothetical protein
MELSIQFLPKALKSLENNLEALRIKKFIYCLTKRRWKNDVDIVNRYSLEDLIFELIRIQPTINRLSLAIYELVKSLNRQQVYAAIASIILEKLAPIYNVSQDDIKSSQVYQLLKEKISKKNPSSHGYINLMEVLVKEVIFQELEKLSPKNYKLLNREEVIAYALNRLPTLYVTSEEEKIEQMKKARSMKERIHLVVVESIETIMNKPVCNSTPLRINSIFSRKMPD